MNMEKLSMNGHSFGAMTSVAASIEDRRIKACTSMDPWIGICIENQDLTSYNFAKMNPIPCQVLTSEGFQIVTAGPSQAPELLPKWWKAMNDAGLDKRSECVYFLEHGHAT